MLKLSPYQYYQQMVTQEDFFYDLAQENAIKLLQIIYDELLQEPVKKYWWSKPKTLPVKGLYLWGGVGRGKTYLMDIFFDALPITAKLRAHFHHFMYRIHTELEQLKGQRDLLLIIAKQMAKQYRVICFDEFYVSDITDAMLLGRLFEALFAEGIVLVATSNIAPDDLYRNGLQRARFLPAIAQINQHCRVLHLDAETDYRLRTLENAEIYHYPLDALAEQNLQCYFEQLVGGQAVLSEPLDIDGRKITIDKQAQGVLLIDFENLCDGPRSQRDYIALAHQFHTVLLRGLVQMGDKQTGDDIARRFLAVIDEFYERKVKLIISSEVPVADIYTQGKLSFEFERCRSRLIEMQSRDYLALPHQL